MKEKITNSREKILDIVFSCLFSSMILFFLGDVGLVNLFILIPFVVISVKYSYKEFFILFILTALSSLLFMNIVKLATEFLFILLMTVLIVELIKREYKFGNIILYGTIVSSILIILGSLFTIFVMKINIIEDLKVSFNLSATEIERMFNMEANLPKEQIDALMVQIKLAFNYLLNNVVAVMICYSFIVASINTVLSIKLLNKTYNNFNLSLKLNKLKMGNEIKPFIKVVLLVWIISLIIKYPYAELINSNLNTIIYFLLFINGILVIDYILESKVNKVLSYIAIIAIIFIFKGIILFVIVGFMDVIFDLRKEKKYGI